MNLGPIYYRGRLDGTAHVIIIGQDPAADENMARRILVGAAGQRVQGFLRKLGLTKSYVMVNTFIYGLKGQIDAEAKQISASAPIKNWRNQLLDMLKTGQTEAVIAPSPCIPRSVRTDPFARTGTPGSRNCARTSRRTRA
jgi:uracil DNA glycosylase superfamily protein